jgi:hypothetical protein
MTNIRSPAKLTPGMTLEPSMGKKHNAKIKTDKAKIGANL